MRFGLRLFLRHRFLRMEPLDLVRCPPLRGVRQILERHPQVREISDWDEPSLQFVRREWTREVHSGHLLTAQHGLVELMDNNPLVCADEASVPSAAGTLALVALGPVIRAGILAEPPVLLFSFPEAAEGSSERWLETVGWSGGAEIAVEPVELGSVRAVTAIAAIASPDDPLELAELYDEAFGRSFFVHRDEVSEWDAALVAGSPFAKYRLRFTPDTPTGLLTVRVIADIDGKLGAAQLVHAMNVMSGFEESVGIA